VWAKSITLAEINKTTHEKRSPHGSMMTVRSIGEEILEKNAQSRRKVFFIRARARNGGNKIIARLNSKEADRIEGDRADIAKNMKAYMAETTIQCFF
jgi:hypothetical protein